MNQRGKLGGLAAGLALLLVLGLAGPTLAGHWGMGPGCGLGFGHGYGPGGQMTPEQAAKAFDLRQKFMNDTINLRRQLAVKQAELGELWRAKEPDKNKIAAKQKEINALRDQLQEQAIAHRLEMQAVCPMGGPGMGPGPYRGGGPGPGPGPGPRP